MLVVSYTVIVQLAPELNFRTKFRMYGGVLLNVKVIYKKMVLHV